MKALILLLLLPACAGSSLAVPVAELETTVAGWLASEGPGADYNGDGYIDDYEWITFERWVWRRLTLIYPGPVPGAEPLMTEKERRDAARAGAQAAGDPIPKAYR